MNILTKLLTAGVFAITSLGANAELLATDYLSEGDMKSTLDTQSGLEWLDLTYTDGMSIDQVKAALPTTFSGWRMPTPDEVVSLMMHAIPSKADFVQTLGNASWFYNDISLFQEVDNFASFFGYTQDSGQHHYSMGMFESASGQTLYSGILDDQSPSYDMVLYSGALYSSKTNAAHNSVGVFLVSDGGTTLSSINNPNINNIGFSGDVNAPADVDVPVALGLVGLLGLLAGPRRKQA